MRKQGLVVRVLLVGVSDLEQDVIDLGGDEIIRMTVDYSKNRQDIDLLVNNQMKGLTRHFEEETLTTIASKLKEKGSFQFLMRYSLYVARTLLLLSLSTWFCSVSRGFSSQFPQSLQLMAPTACDFPGHLLTIFKLSFFSTLKRVSVYGDTLDLH